MRSLAQAATAGSNLGDGAGRARLRRFGLGALLALCVLALTAPSAFAAGDPTRAYEQVTPINKEGGVVGNKVGFQGDPSGEAFVYQAINVFSGAVSEAAPRISQFISRRQPDSWTGAMQLDPPSALPSIGGAFFSTIAVSADLSKAFVVSNRALTPGAVAGQNAGNLYVRDAHTGAFTFIGTAEEGFQRFRQHHRWRLPSPGGARFQLAHLSLAADAAGRAGFGRLPLVRQRGIEPRTVEQRDLLG